MKREFIRNVGGADRGFIDIAIVPVGPRSPIFAGEKRFAWVSVSAKPQEECHSLVRQENEPRPIIFDRCDIDAVAVSGHIANFKPNQFKGAAPGIERTEHKLAQVSPAMTQEVTAFATSQMQETWTIHVWDASQAAPGPFTVDAPVLPGHLEGHS